MASTSPPRWRRLLDSPAAPVTLMVMSAGLIALTILRFSVWIDESATLLLVGPHSVGEILSFTSWDAHPPLWYLVLKPWLAIFGANPLAARSQSAIFMLAAFGVWYHFVKVRFSRPTALLALALLVTNPMLLHQAIEGRMYAFGTLLVASSCLLITGRWRWRWVAYWPCAVAMLWTHYFLAFVLLAQFLYLLVTRKEQARSFLWIVIFGATIVATFLPQLSRALHMTNLVVANGFWIGPLTPNSVVWYVWLTFLHRLDHELEGWKFFIAIIYIAAWGCSLVRAGRLRGGPYALLWLIATIPMLCLFILSCKPFVPIFHARYVVFGLPAVITLLAAGALSLAGRWRVLAIAILIAGHVSGILMLRWKGFNDTRGYWAMKAVAKDVSKPIDGELPTVVSSWVFTFLDARATLDEKQRVVNFRESAPLDYGFPDVMYAAHPEWYVLSLDDIHARHVWFLDEHMHAETEVPKSWKLEVMHYRGYARERLYTLPDSAVSPPPVSPVPSNPVPQP